MVVVVYGDYWFDIGNLFWGGEDIGCIDVVVVVYWYFICIVEDVILC